MANSSTLEDNDNSSGKALNNLDEIRNTLDKKQLQTRHSISTSDTHLILKRQKPTDNFNLTRCASFEVGAFTFTTPFENSINPQLQTTLDQNQATSNRSEKSIDSNSHSFQILDNNNNFTVETQLDNENKSNNSQNLKSPSFKDSPFEERKKSDELSTLMVNVDSTFDQSIVLESKTDLTAEQTNKIVVKSITVSVPLENDKSLNESNNNPNSVQNIPVPSRIEEDSKIDDFAKNISPPLEVSLKTHDSSNEPKKDDEINPTIDKLKNIDNEMFPNNNLNKSNLRDVETSDKSQSSLSDKRHKSRLLKRQKRFNADDSSDCAQDNQSINAKKSADEHQMQQQKSTHTVNQTNKSIKLNLRIKLLTLF